MMRTSARRATWWAWPAHLAALPARLLRGLLAREGAETRLRETEQQYRLIFEAASDGLVIRSLDDFSIVAANSAYCQMHGGTAEQLVGSTFAAEAARHRYLTYRYALQRDGQFRCQALARRMDGSTFHVEMLGTTITYEGRPHLFLAQRDVSEQVAALHLLEQRVAERTRELTTLLDISHDVAATLELCPLLDLILEQLEEVVDFGVASIWIREGEVLVNRSHRSTLAAPVPLPSEVSLADATGCWDFIRQGEPLLLPDIATGDGQTVLHAWMGIPLVTKERLVGGFVLQHTVPGFYTPAHAQLALAVANQAAVAIENARLYEEAQRLAALQERQRLARELHDSVSQALYGIALGARTARTWLDRDPSRAVEPLDYVLALADAGLTEMRALIFELRPESLEIEGLVAALAKQAASLQVRHGLQVQADLGEEPAVSSATKEALYRVAQEAMHNTVKHARASRLDLHLACVGDDLCLAIRDDGIGFDTSRDFPGHLGLRSMAERVERLRGSLLIESTPGQGTCIRALVPWVP